jgi:peptidyl-prolyl cis-trans isomerase B (cyclophilin B)
MGVRVPTNEQRREAAKRKLERQLARRAERAKRRRVYAVVGSAITVILIVGFIAAVLIFFRGGGETDTAAEPSVPPLEPSPTSTPVEIPAEIAPPPTRAQPVGPVDCQYPPSPQPASRPVQPPPPGAAPTEGTVPVTFQTSVGAVPATLDRAVAPCTVASFLSLSQQGFYNDTPCHRLTTSPGLGVLQCGDPTGQGTGGPGYTIPDEVFPELTYGRGYLAMANTGAPGSGGSQFFIVYGSAAALNSNPTYTVFGTISAEGLAVIDEVARAGVVGGGEDGPPATPVQIQQVTIPG